MSNSEAPAEAGNTILGVRLEPTLREQIKALAKADGRTESGFVRFHLEKLVELEESKLEGVES